jgi:hypothetical protein
MLRYCVRNILYLPPEEQGGVELEDMVYLSQEVDQKVT